MVTPMVTLYGIQSCDTCRKARQWLAGAGIEHRWVALREDGVSRDRIAAWCETLGPAALINKRSTTWREFDDTARARALAAPVSTLAEYSTLIKRPVLVTMQTTMAGFSATRYEAALAGAD